MLEVVISLAKMARESRKSLPKFKQRVSGAKRIHPQAHNLYQHIGLSKKP